MKTSRPYFSLSNNLEHCLTSFPHFSGFQKSAYQLSEQISRTSIILWFPIFGSDSRTSLWKLLGQEISSLPHFHLSSSWSETLAHQFFETRVSSLLHFHLSCREVELGFLAFQTHTSILSWLPASVLYLFCVVDPLWIHSRSLICLQMQITI